MIKILLAYRSAAASALITIGSLFVMQRFQNGWVFGGVCIIWFFLLALLMFHGEKRMGHHRQFFRPVLFTAIGCTGLASLIEAPPMRLLVNVVSGASVSLFFIVALHRAHGTLVSFGRWRRLLVILFSFVLYAYAVSFSALVLFFSSLPSTLFALLFGIAAGYSGFAIWSLYEYTEQSHRLGWSILLGLLCGELFWVLQLLPFGYLALGLLAAWVWYTLQLLFRFHLSSKGILWKKQLPFLCISFLGYLVILFYIIRWL